MDESTFEKLASATFRAIGDGFEHVDPDLVDCEIAGDVITLTLRSGKRYVVNTQRPTRQIWFAANATAWHFGWDADAERWVDDKGRGELFDTIARAVRDGAAVDVAFSRVR